MPVQAQATCCRPDLSVEVLDKLQHHGGKWSNANTAVEDEGAKSPTNPSPL